MFLLVHCYCKKLPKKKKLNFTEFFEKIGEKSIPIISSKDEKIGVQFTMCLDQIFSPALVKGNQTPKMGMGCKSTLFISSKDEKFSVQFTGCLSQFFSPTLVKGGQTPKMEVDCCGCGTTWPLGKFVLFNITH